jgi:hypothetical protein
LQIKSITVLSTVARIEDFYREFYSRTRVSSVKVFGSDNVSKSQFAPLDIYFGTYLSIPAYIPTSKTCPFCAEIDFLNNISNNHYSFDLYKNRLEEFVSYRIEEIKLLSNKIDNKGIAIPKSKNRNESIIKEVFYVREKLGRVDSYRFYKEIFDSFDSLVTNIQNSPDWYLIDDIKKEIEIILICIFVEPDLIRLCENLLRNNYLYLKEYVEHILMMGLETTYYLWDNYQFVRVAFSFFETTYINKSILSINEWYKELDLIFSFSSTNSTSIDFIFFKLYSFILRKPEKAGHHHRDNIVYLYNERAFLFEEENDLKKYIQNIFSTYYEERNQSNEKLCNSFSLLQVYLLKRKGNHLIWIKNIADINDKINVLNNVENVSQIKLEVERLVNEYDSNLKRPIESILSLYKKDEHFPELVTTFISKTDGFVTMIEELRGLDCSDLDRLTIILDNIREHFSEKKVKHPSELLALAENYPVGIKKEVNDFFTTAVITAFEGDVSIDISKYFLIKMFNEILQNSKAHNNELIKISLVEFNAQITLELYFKNAFKLELLHHEGGLRYAIREIIDAFCGTYTDNSEQHDTPYFMRISLNKSFIQE